MGRLVYLTENPILVFIYARLIFIETSRLVKN